MQKINDSLATLLGGLGDPNRDKAAGIYYGFPLITDDQLLNSYRGSWLARKIVNIPAQDSVRKWRDWQAEADQITFLEKEERRLGVRQKLYQAMVRARLFGGAAIVIGTGETDLETSLPVERIKKGGVRYLTVMSRLELTAGETDWDVTSEFYGQPREYTVARTSQKIHPSRIAIFIGDRHPEPQFNLFGPVGWGDSVLTAMFRAVTQMDATFQNVANLVFEANVDVFGVPDLLDSIADPEYQTRMMQRFGLVAANKGINGSILRDAAETYERKTIAFGGTHEIIDKFILNVCGASDIPATRLFGMSPAGLSATGESDLRNYYDSIAANQTVFLQPSIDRLDECVIRSALGARPEEIFYNWSPLWQISEKERSEIGKANAETAETMLRSNLIPGEALSRAVVNQMTENGFYPGLEQMVEDAPPIDFTEPQPIATTDARPMTLYIRRDVVNVADIRKWAKDQGIPEVQDGLHVTIAYSKTPVDWIKVGESWQGQLKLAAGGPRLMERFGNAVVLQFASTELHWRHQSVIEAGGSYDFEEYQPHITLFYEMPGMTVDLDAIEPYRGEIILGPEIFDEI